MPNHDLLFLDLVYSWNYMILFGIYYIYIKSAFSVVDVAMEHIEIKLHVWLGNCRENISLNIGFCLYYRLRQCI